MPSQAGGRTMRRAKQGRYPLLFTLAFVWSTVGCSTGGASPPSGQSANDQAAPASSLTTQRANADSAELNKPKAAPTGTGEPVAQASSADSSADSTSRPADGTVQVVAAASETRAPQEPATARQAIAVIDLSKFPRLNEMRFIAELNNPTYLSYESRSSVAAAAAYHRTEL